MENDLLQQLRDIHTPEIPAAWPPAPGWWILSALAAALFAYALWRLYRRWRAYAPAREAARLYRLAHQQYQGGELAADAYLNTSNALLKRLAIYTEPTTRPLTGSAWLSWLDRRSHMNEFSSGAGSALEAVRFQPAPEFDADALNHLLARFFRLERRRFWGISP